MATAIARLPTTVSIGYLDNIRNQRSPARQSHAHQPSPASLVHVRDEMQVNISFTPITSSRGFSP
jgi:hypothetical protein